jgi:hypothetical protein
MPTRSVRAGKIACENTAKLQLLGKRFCPTLRANRFGIVSDASAERGSR